MAPSGTFKNTHWVCVEWWIYEILNGHEDATWIDEGDRDVLFLPIVVRIKITFSLSALISTSTIATTTRKNTVVPSFYSCYETESKQ
jgi:hypothetical protein